MNKIVSWLLNDLKTTYQKTGFIKSISLLAIGGAIMFTLTFISIYLAFFFDAVLWIIWIIEAIGEVDKQNRGKP